MMKALRRRPSVKVGPGLYFHLPFCRKRCGYCAFVSQTPRKIPEAQYLRAMLREMETRADDFRGLTLTSVYFGGGTPSLFQPAAIRRLLGAAKDCFVFSPETEVTLEANPESVSGRRLEGYRAAGVNRLSLGVQTFSPSRLSLLGRIHSAAQSRRAAAAARAAGFENLSLDLIYALPGQSLAELETDLNLALELEPEHVSAYELTWEKGTALEKSRRQGRVRPLEEALAAEMFLLVAERLSRAGLRRYEVSNFSRPGFECRHNLSGWKLTPYLGLGAGAHSLLPSGERQANFSDLKRYLAQVKKTGKAIGQREPPELERARREFIMLALRTADGISWREYRARFGRDLWKEKSALLRSLVRMKMADLNSRRVRLSERGFLLADSVALVLL